MWISREHPQQYSNILAKGKLIHNEVAGKTLVKMMQQWRQDNEPLDSFSR